MPTIRVSKQNQERLQALMLSMMKTKIREEGPAAILEISKSKCKYGVSYDTIISKLLDRYGH